MPGAARIDRTGAIFDRWTVIAYAHRSAGGHYWLCRCVCGVERAVSISNLCARRTHSCGCWNAEVRQRRHGGVSGTKEYRAWFGIISGRRGVAFDPRWKDFATFRAEVGAAPAPDHCLVRRDHSAPIGPRNFQWVARKDGGCGRVGKILWHGKRLTLRAVAEKLGVSHQAVSLRVQRGWSVDEIVARPKMPGVPPPSRPRAERARQNERRTA